MPERRTKRHWRFYRTAGSASPVDAFLNGLTAGDKAAVAAGLARVRSEGLVAARHLRGDIYEVRVSGFNRDYRILFATEGRFNQILLAVHAIEKRTQRT